jgi:probable FeS assembly SUF system protein SufT
MSSDVRREPVLVQRSLEATQIPGGYPIPLQAGTHVVVQQVLDGNFTVMTERDGLARIEGKDADALGAAYVEIAQKAVEARAVRREGPFDESKVWDELRTVFDPEIPANIVDLGLIYEVSSEAHPEGGRRVTVQMTLTAPGCGVGPMIVDEVKRKVQALPGVGEAAVELVFDPPWDQSRMSEAARLALGLY